MNRLRKIALLMAAGLSLTGWGLASAPAAVGAVASVVAEISATEVVAGESVTLTATVSGARSTDAVVVARRTGATWAEIDREPAATQSEYRFEVEPPPLGRTVFRVALVRGSRVLATSTPLAVHGLPAVDPSGPEAGERVNVRGTLPSPVVRRAALQAKVDGQWRTVDLDLSTASGDVAFDWTPSQTVSIRITAPAHSAGGVVYPRFVSPAVTVEVKDAEPEPEPEPTVTRLVGPYASNSRISGDGRHLLYLSDPAVDAFAKYTSAYVYTQGGEPRRLVPELGDPATSSAKGLSADGRYVLIETRLGVTNGQPGALSLLVWDAESDEITRLLTFPASVSAPLNAVISKDGSTIAFSSPDAALAPGDTNGVADVYVLDRASKQVRRVTNQTDGSALSGASAVSAVSADGSSVVYTTRVAVSPADTNGTWDAYRWEAGTGDSTAVTALQPSDTLQQVVLSADGRSVGYRVNFTMQQGASYVWDAETGAVQVVPLSGGNPGFNQVAILGLSADARFGLVRDGGTFYRWERRTGEFLPVNDGSERGPDTSSNAYSATISDDGSAVAFDSLPSTGTFQDSAVFLWSTRS